MKEQFPQSWKDQLETLGFDTFTKIQEQIFSPIYEGENVLGISPTGTGKDTRLPLSELAQTQTEEGPTTLDFGS